MWRPAEKPQPTRPTRTCLGISKLSSVKCRYQGRGTAWVPRAAPAPLHGLTPSQKRFIGYLQTHQITFGVGAAGTGKTYVAAAVAADALRAGEVDSIIVTRPLVGAEDDVGALPGTLDEKIAPFIAPVRAILEERLGKGQVEYMIKAEKIRAMPVAFLRGHSLAHSFILADEAQNLTPRQFKLLLTRIGQGTRMAITGDTRQTDIRDSGLIDAINRIRHIPAVAVVEFDRSDVVRSSVVAEILLAYDE